MRRLLSLIALLLPAPALADVTASYAAGKAVLRVEVDDGGNARAGIDGKFALIHRDGVDYIVFWSPDGAPHVTRAEDALAQLGKHAPHQDKLWKTELSAQGDMTVAGHPGTVWRIGPGGGQAPGEFVMSADPALAPIGQIFARVGEAFGAFADAHGPPGSDAAAGMRSLFSHGTPVLIRDAGVEPSPGRLLVELQSVSTAEIDPHRFDLPGPVVSGEAFMAAAMRGAPEPIDAPPVKIAP